METIRIKVWDNIRSYIFFNSFYGRVDIINGFYLILRDIKRHTPSTQIKHNVKKNILNSISNEKY